MILCYGIRNSDNPILDWEYVNEMHDKEASTDAKSSLLRALACTKNDGLLDR